MNLENMLKQSFEHGKNKLIDALNKPKTQFSRFMTGALVYSHILLATTAFSNNPVIEGKVTNNIHQGNPTTQVVAYDGADFGNESAAPMLQTTTAPSGVYKLDFATIDVDEYDFSKHETKAWPNPFRGQTKIDFVAKEAGMHTINFYNTLGQVVESASFNAHPREIKTINVDGLGQPGMYIADIQGANTRESIKLMQQNRAQNAGIFVQDAGTIELKSEIVDAPQTIWLRYISDSNHAIKDTLVSWENHPNLDVELQQIAHQGNANFEANIMTTPFNLLLDNITLSLYNGADSLTTVTTDAGFANANLMHEYFVFNNDTIRTLNDKQITELTVKASGEGLENRSYVIPFNENMKLDDLIEVTPTQQKTTTIKTTLHDDKFNYLINGAQLTFENAENNKVIAQATTNSNGENTTNIQYKIWEWPSLGLIENEVNNIRLKANNTHHEEYQTTITNNNQELNLILTQIAEQLNATITGQVTNTANEPINAASVKIKTGEETHTTTSTNTQGQFTIQNFTYKQYTNHNDPTQKLTEPAHIQAEITKPEYQTTTTQNKTLEDVINFGNIILNAETNLITFTFTPSTVNGTPLEPETKINFKHGNQIESILIGQQTNITVNIDATSNNLKIWSESPVNQDNVPKYNDLIIIREHGADWYVQPIANNNSVLNRIYANQSIDTLIIPTSKINNRHDLAIELVPAYFDHEHYGRLYINQVPLAYIMAGISQGKIQKQVLDPTNNKRNIIIQTFYEQNGETRYVSQQFINSWTYGANQTINAAIRQDGQKTWDAQIIIADHPNHPEYINAQNNNLFNTILIVPTPNVSMATNTPLGDENGITGGYITAPIGEYNTNVTTEEIYETTGFTDAPNYPSTGNYIITNGEINTIGKTIKNTRNRLMHNTSIVYTLNKK